VSLEGPFGPRLPATNPTVPSASRSRIQRRSVSRVIPNPSAIATPVAALIRANWVAATRRPVPSPASHANTNSPRT